MNISGEPPEKINLWTGGNKNICIPFTHEKFYGSRDKFLVLKLNCLTYFMPFWTTLIIFGPYIASTKFCQDAAKRPDINLLVVWKSQNNLRSTIGPWLNIRAKVICFKTTTSKINDLHLTPTIAFNQNILWFQVAVY